jgi:DNA-binding NtrC family response regulator
LFGHERGAYTSASTLQRGLIEEANGGTFFLDEIDCLPALAQVKLLRFLQEKEYRPIGSARARRADVRIIAASNLKLEEAVENGTMRQDLYYRLNIISLNLPPLRERREDIPLLTAHFNRKYSREFDTESLSLTPETLHSLLAHSWPGNVRELEYVIQRAIVLGEAPAIGAADPKSASTAWGASRESLREAKAQAIALFEKNYLQGVLSASRGNITRAAEMAKKNRRAFWQLIHKHKIDVKKFKSSAS